MVVKRLIELSFFHFFDESLDYKLFNKLFV